MKKYFKSWDAVQKRLAAWRRLKRIESLKIKQEGDMWVVEHEEPNKK